MGSFSSLNSYSSANVSSTISTTLYLEEGNDFQLPMPSWFFATDIGTLTGNALTITHNLDPVANLAATFGNTFAVTFPRQAESPNVSISNVGNTWTISNVRSAVDYFAVDGFVDVPPDFAGNVTYTTVLTNTNASSIPQTLNVNLIVVDKPEVTNLDLTDVIIPFGSNVAYGGPSYAFSGTQLSNFAPEENQPGIYTVTITTQNGSSNLVLSTTSNTSLNINSWTGTASQGVLTLAGSKANVNAHINTLQVAGDGTLDLWFNKQFTWRFVNPSGFTTTLTQRYIQYHFSNWFVTGMTGNTINWPSNSVFFANVIGNTFPDSPNDPSYYNWPTSPTNGTVSSLRLRDALHVADDLSSSSTLGPIKIIAIGNATISNGTQSFTKVDVDGAGNSYATFQMASGNTYIQNFSRYSIDSGAITLPGVGDLANTANVWHPAPYSPFTLNTTARLENGANIGSSTFSYHNGDLVNKALEWQYDRIVPGSDSAVIYTDTGVGPNFQRQARFVFQTQTSQYLNYNQLKITVDSFAGAGNAFGWTSTGGYYGTWPIGSPPPTGSGLNSVSLSFEISPVTFQQSKTWGGDNVSLGMTIWNPGYGGVPPFVNVVGPWYVYSVIVSRYNSFRNSSATPGSNYVPSPYYIPLTSIGEQLVYGLYRSAYTTPFKADGTSGTTSWSAYAAKPQFFRLTNTTATRTRQGTVTLTFGLSNPVSGAVPQQNAAWTTSGSITKSFTIYY